MRNEIMQLKKLVFALIILMIAVPVIVAQDNSPASKKSTAVSSGETIPKTPAPAKERIDPCKLKQPCKECMPIYEKITAGCKRLDEIDKELHDLAEKKTRNTNEQTSIQYQIPLLEKQAGPANRIGPLKEKLKGLQAELQKIEIDTRDPGLARLELERKLQDYVNLMKDCEKTRCGSGNIYQFPKEEFIPH